MNILDIFENESAKPGYQTEKDDNSALRISDIRKTQLTLKQINRLRIMNDIRKLEHETNISQVQNQYKTPSQEPGSI